MEVFRCQMVAEVFDILRAGSIYLCKVPTNMTHLFQRLNLTVGNHCKVFSIVVYYVFSFDLAKA